MKADKIPSIKSAHEAMRRACEAYSDAVITAIPVGSTVSVEHGGKWIGPYVVKAVSNAWWSTPGRLWLQNPRTGKSRWAGPLSIRILEAQEQ